MAKVSIVIPTYNAAAYIKETLLSILSQNHSNFEIVIVDDHSTDNTATIIESFKDPRIRYILLDRNHGGPSLPRNVGIKAAQAKYIAFFDSDDLMMPGRLKQAVDFLQKFPPLGLVFTNSIKFYENGDNDHSPFLTYYKEFKSMSFQKIGEDKYIFNPDEAYSCLLAGNFILTGGVTVPKKIFDQIGYFDETLRNADDWDMWLRIVRHYPIGFIDMIGFRYRVRDRSVSSRGYSLAYNRIKVLNKQLQFGLNNKNKKKVKLNIAENLNIIGYAFQEQGNMKEARRYYLQSLKENFNKMSLRGVIITLMGVPVVRFLKKYLKSKDTNLNVRTL